MSIPLVVGCTVGISPAAQTKLRDTFKGFHFYPKANSPSCAESETFASDELAEIEVFFTTGRGLPPVIKNLDQMPKLRHIQLGSAGADKALKSEVISQLKGQAGSEAKGGITLSTASGTHVLSIPPYVVGMVIALYHQLPRMILKGRDDKRWMSEEEADINGETYFARSLYGRTAGLLGYGALGRETARLLKSHGMKVIAANTSGKATPQDGYVIPGTGDPQGSIPEQYYSSKDSASLEAFLKRSDVLVCSLPSTPQTKYLLNKDKLAMLPPHAVLVNVGRGDLIPTDDLMAALEAPNGLWGAALDVTDPEPLPSGHALWSHPKVVITPHTSGNTEGEMDIAAEIALTNARRIAEGKEVINRVRFDRGY
ncbi:hypothetical protein IAU60_004947 [Kwoniella sp. DSM 27419]